MINSCAKRTMSAVHYHRRPVLILRIQFPRIGRRHKISHRLHSICKHISSSVCLSVSPSRVSTNVWFGLSRGTYSSMHQCIAVKWQSSTNNAHSSCISIFRYLFVYTAGCVHVSSSAASETFCFLRNVNAVHRIHRLLIIFCQERTGNVRIGTKRCTQKMCLLCRVSTISFEHCTGERPHRTKPNSLSFDTKTHIARFFLFYFFCFGIDATLTLRELVSLKSTSRSCCCLLSSHSSHIRWCVCKCSRARRPPNSTKEGKYVNNKCNETDTRH